MSFPDVQQAILSDLYRVVIDVLCGRTYIKPIEMEQLKICISPPLRRHRRQRYMYDRSMSSVIGYT
ncbi:hypothetical protein BCEN4_350165 [Burkholderia cenocepacia]|nr:hypothetical protein BCEN4_350165 [Burkholderia cenocepacia]